ncbi:hypothetical protein MNBD_BACTEROID01-836 [hydrothermal vent metagenome]|uniref:ABC-type transport system involved in multi-copper enzyme maturation, permease component n=1 Tax=hydrothermal vent metagenome TaxID=652676 RepID=A0A3B0UYV4_9ZZZZ
MLKHIVIKEIQEHIKGYKFNIVFISCIVLLGFNQLVMYQNYDSKLSDSNLKFPSSEEQPIQKVADPLSIYVTGTSELLDRVFKYDKNSSTLVELHILNIDIFRQYFPLIDYNYLIRVILSFLAMVVGFDAFCGEKQQGTLKLILSNSVKRSTLIWGKILGNFLILILPLIFTSLLYYIILSFKTNIHFTPSDNIRLLLMMLISIIYLSIFLIISIAVSASSTTVTVSIIKNFIIWVFLIFIISNPFSLLFNSNEYKLPDGRSIVDKYFINRIENSRDTTRLVAQEKAFFDYVSDVLNYRNKLKKQIRMIELSSLVIPSDAFNLCITSLARCGLQDENNFRMAILQYHKERHDGEKDSGFNYKGIGLASSINSCLKYFISLILLMLTVLLVAINKFNHYDIR